MLRKKRRFEEINILILYLVYPLFKYNPFIFVNFITRKLNDRISYIIIQNDIFTPESHIVVNPQQEKFK